MNLKRYVLANPEARLPMPDRGGRLFSPKGETVDADSAFWAARVADGELIEVKGSSASRDGSEAMPPVAPAGRANVPDGQSALRPAADGRAAINDIPPALPVKRKGK